jgi:hypothetical protein
LDDINITARLKGDYTATGLITPWISLNGVNSSAFGSGGVVSGYDYTIIYNSSSNTYNAINGTTGIVDFTNANPDVTIEWAWTALPNGGSFYTKGVGTWTFDAKVDSQGDNVKWVSSPGLLFQAKNGLNDHMVRVQLNDNCTLEGLRIDHDYSNQNTGSCIYVYQADRTKVIDCDLYRGREWGIEIKDSDYVDVIRVNVLGVGTDDGIEFSFGCDYGTATDCFVTRCGGNGYVAYQATYITFTRCIAYQIQDQYGIGDPAGQEHGFTSQSSYMVNFYQCISIDNGKCGFITTEPLGGNSYTGFYDCTSIGNGEHGLQLWAGHQYTVSGGTYRDNGHPEIEVWNCDATSISGVRVDGDQIGIHVQTSNNSRVVDSYFNTTSTGLDMAGAGVENLYVDGNNFVNTADAVTAVGAVNPGWGTNLDENNTWDHHIEP